MSGCCFVKRKYVNLFSSIERTLQSRLFWWKRKRDPDWPWQYFLCQYTKLQIIKLQDSKFFTINKFCTLILQSIFYFIYVPHLSTLNFFRFLYNSYPVFDTVPGFEDQTHNILIVSRLLKPVDHTYLP